MMASWCHPFPRGGCWRPLCWWSLAVLPMKIPLEMPWTKASLPVHWTSHSPAKASCCRSCHRRKGTTLLSWTSHSPARANPLLTFHKRMKTPLPSRMSHIPARASCCHRRKGTPLLSWTSHSPVRASPLLKLRRMVTHPQSQMTHSLVRGMCPPNAHSWSLKAVTVRCWM